MEVERKYSTKLSRLPKWKQSITQSRLTDNNDHTELSRLREVNKVHRMDYPKFSKLSGVYYTGQCNRERIAQNYLSHLSGEKELPKIT